MRRFEGRLTWLAVAILAITVGTGCSEPEAVATPSPVPELIETQAPPVSSPEPATATATATTAAEAEVIATPELTATPEPAPAGVHIQDDFVDASSGWPAQDYDNYYIGYHEPEWYHVEVRQPNDYAAVVLQEQIFDDVTVETEVFVEESLSAPEGDFRYGLVLRRSGKQFYAFTISPRTKSWSVIKSSPTSLAELQSGTMESIGAEGRDRLRVDADGSRFTFTVNGQQASQVEDGDYNGGELGFFVQTFDSPRAHIHYDSLMVSDVGLERVLYDDTFQSSGSGWQQQAYDNYYLGYHEPDWYHVEVQAQNDSAVSVVPGQSFDNVTAETEAFVEEGLSAAEGDFQYGLVLRRMGRQFYAFAISPRTSTWRVLKSSATALQLLDQGSYETTGDAAADTLRVDAIGSSFTFHINDQQISNVHDADYSEGELGFYVETFDSPRAHIHYDSLTVREVNMPAPLCTVTAASLNLRAGPGVAYRPPIAALLTGTELEPLARSAFLPWIQVRVQGSEQVGWVYADPIYATCNFALADLPLP